MRNASKTITVALLPIALVLVAVMSFPVAGQDLAATITSSTQRLERLRLQAAEAKLRQLQLEEYIRVLDIQLQPDNIQRAINQIGSLSGDELREQRRRRLETEKTKAQEQLRAAEDDWLNIEKSIYLTEIEVARIKAGAATLAQQSVTPPRKSRP